MCGVVDGVELGASDCCLNDRWKNFGRSFGNSNATSDLAGDGGPRFGSVQSSVLREEWGRVGVKLGVVTVLGTALLVFRKPTSNNSQ